MARGEGGWWARDASWSQGTGRIERAQHRVTDVGGRARTAEIGSSRPIDRHVDGALEGSCVLGATQAVIQKQGDRAQHCCGVRDAASGDLRGGSVNRFEEAGTIVTE